MANFCDPFSISNFDMKMIFRFQFTLVLILVSFYTSECFACRGLDFDYVRSDLAYLKEKQCSVFHVEIGEACHNGDWKKVVKLAKVLKSKHALDQHPLFCLARAYLNLGYGKLALNTFLKAKKAETQCELEYWGTCTGHDALTQYFNSRYGITPPMEKAYIYYSIVPYLEAAGKPHERDDAIKKGDEIIESNCPPEKDMCEHIKSYMKGKAGMTGYY
jgi:hypothetical protein